jgi:hypothetical protein
METIFNENVSDLPDGKKQSLEAILGRHLEAHQRVYIQVFDPNAVPDEATRKEALASLEKTFAKTDQYAKDHGISALEADAAVAEAMDQVRHRPS